MPDRESAQASKPIGDICMFAVYVSSWRCVMSGCFHSNLFQLGRVINPQQSAANALKFNKFLDSDSGVKLSVVVQVMLDYAVALARPLLQTLCIHNADYAARVLDKVLVL
jgi:hypothetical protein